MKRNWRTCLIGCGTALVAFGAIVAVLLPKACPGEVAQWTDRSEGTIWIAPGMTRAQVEQRATTKKIGKYGDSNRFVDFVLPEEGLKLHGIQQFMFTEGKSGTVESVSMLSVNESWPDLLYAAKQTEAILLAHGWKPEPGQKRIDSLPSDPREAAKGITDSGAIAGANFTWTKGNRVFTMEASGLWGGIRWWQSARGADVFWRNMTYGTEAGR